MSSLLLSATASLACCCCLLCVLLITAAISPASSAECCCLQTTCCLLPAGSGQTAWGPAGAAGKSQHQAAQHQPNGCHAGSPRCHLCGSGIPGCHQGNSAGERDHAAGKAMPAGLCLLGRAGLTNVCSARDSPAAVSLNCASVRRRSCLATLHASVTTVQGVACVDTVCVTTLRLLGIEQLFLASNCRER